MKTCLDGSPGYSACHQKLQINWLVEGGDFVIVGWGVFDIFTSFTLFDQLCFLVVIEWKLPFLGGYQNPHPMPALLPCHKLKIDRRISITASVLVSN